MKMQFISPGRAARAACVAFSLLGSAVAFAQSADLVISGSHTPTSAPAGSAFTVTFHVSNAGPDTATNTVLTATIAPPASGSVTMDSLSGCSFNSGSMTMTCNLGNLPASPPQITITPVFRLNTDVGVWTLEYEVSSDTTDPTSSNNSGSTTITTTASTDLKLTTSITSPLDLKAGQSFSYDLQVENLGPSTVPASGTVVTFTVPSNVQYTGITGGGWSCSPGNGSAGTAVTCRVTSALNLNDSRTLTINATALGSQAGTIDTIFSASAYDTSGHPTDPNLTNNTATVSVSISSGTDVSIAKSSAISPSEQIVFTIAPTYRAGDSLEGIPIIVTDTYDGGMFVFDGWVSDPSDDGWSCVTPVAIGLATHGSLMQFTCTRTGYDGGKGTSMPAIKFTANIISGVPTATNTVKIELTGRDDPDSTNDSAATTINTSGEADLVTYKTPSFTPIVTGQGFEYTIYTRNNGPWHIPSGQVITVTDDLPDTLTLLEAPYADSGWTCEVTQNGTPVTTYPIASTTADPVTITCTYSGGLSSGGRTPDIKLRVMSNANGDLYNEACSVLAPKVNPSDREDPNPTNDCSEGGHVGITTESADLKLTKTASSNLVDAGQPLTYTLTLTNDGPDTATNVTLDDSLLSLVNAGGVQSLAITTQPASDDASCNIDGNANPTFPLNGTSHVLQCKFPTLTNNETAVVEVTILPNIASSGDRANTATAYSADQGDPDRDSNTATATSEVNAVFDLKVTTQATTAIASPATEAAVNSVLTFTTRVSSVGLSTAPTAQAVITFPANAEIIQITSAGGATCTPAINTLPGTTGGNMTCEWPSGIASGVNRDITYQVLVPNSIGDTIAHSASVGLITPGNPRPETDLTNNDASAQVTIIPATADVQVNISDSPDPVALGSTTTHTILVKNNGPSSASNVVLEASYVPDTASFGYGGNLLVDYGGACIEPATDALSGTLRCTWATLPIGTEAKVTYELTAVAIHTTGATTGQIATTTTVSSDDIDPQPANNSAIETTSVIRDQPASPGVDLSTTKTASVSSVTPGDTFDYTITVHNNGPAALAAAHGAQMIDTLPAAVTLLSTPPECTYNSSTHIVTCLIGALAVNADYVVVLPVRLNVNVGNSQTVANTAIADLPSGGDPDPDNNGGSTGIHVVSSTGIPAMPQWSFALLVLLVTLSAAHLRRKTGRQARNSRDG